MHFCHEDFSVRLLSVLQLSWDEHIAHIEPRPYRGLTFRLQGDANFILPDKWLKAGDKDIVYAPEQPDYDIVAGKEKVIVIHFLEHSSRPTEFMVRTPDDPQRAEALFVSLLECWSKKEPGYYFRALSIFYKIIEMLEIQELHTAHSPRYRIISRAVDFLHENYRNPELTVEDLCKIANISNTYFRKCFHEEFGMMPNKYLNSLRIQYARELLDYGAYSIERVAEEVGFMDSKYFCTVFKRFTGKTPSEYKKGFSVNKD